MTIIIIGLLIFAHLANSAADSIDHRKGSQTLLDLWHILKCIQQYVPAFLIMYLLGFAWYQYIACTLALIIWWNAGYYISNALELYRYDDLGMNWLRKIWGYGEKI